MFIRKKGVCKMSKNNLMKNLLIGALGILVVIGADFRAASFFTTM